MSAHFSALYQQSSGLVQWSPDGKYVATAVGQKLAVRDAANGFEIVKVREGSGLNPLQRCLLAAGACFCGSRFSFRLCKIDYTAGQTYK